MVQKIIDGIIAAIRTKYDTSYDIYTESIEQGLIEPCFSVLCLNVTDQPHVGSRRSRGYLFNISYFPSGDEPIAECLEVLENLYDLLSLINVGDAKMHSTEISGTIVDGVLQVQATYTPFLLVSNDTEDGMEEVEVMTSGKE